MRSIIATCAAAAAIASTLGACATAAPTVGPNGRAAFSIKCGGAMVGQCWEKAGQVCPNGYDVVTQGGGKYLGQMSTGYGNASVNKSGGYAHSSAQSVPMVSQGHVLVECR